MQIDFFNVIQFGTDMNEEDKLFITNKRPNQTTLYPEESSNAFNLSYLLKDMNQTQLLDEGGFIQMEFVYDCNLDEPICEPQITVNQLNKPEEEASPYLE